MKRWPALMMLTGPVMFALVGCQTGTDTAVPADEAAPPVQEAVDPEWTVLFDGSTLDGWSVIGGADWQLVDGAVQAESGENGYLVTPIDYDDFELRLEVWTDPPANSGVFIRCSDPEEIAATNAYEINIFDERPDQTYRTGSIVDYAPPAMQMDAANRWNTFVITADGPRLRVVMNDVEMVNIEDSTYTSGPIALQYGGGVVRFRNVQVRPL